MNSQPSSKHSLPLSLTISHSKKEKLLMQSTYTCCALFAEHNEKCHDFVCDKTAKRENSSKAIPHYKTLTKKKRKRRRNVM